MLSCSIIQIYYKIIVIYQKKIEKPIDILIRIDDT